MMIHALDLAQSALVNAMVAELAEQGAFCRPVPEGFLYIVLAKTPSVARVSMLPLIELPPSQTLPPEVIKTTASVLRGAGLLPVFVFIGSERITQMVGLTALVASGGRPPARDGVLMASQHPSVSACKQSPETDRPEGPTTPERLRTIIDRCLESVWPEWRPICTARPKGYVPTITIDISGDSPVCHVEQLPPDQVPDHPETPHFSRTALLEAVRLTEQMGRIPVLALVHNDSAVIGVVCSPDGEAAHG